MDYAGIGTGYTGTTRTFQLNQTNTPPVFHENLYYYRPVNPFPSRPVITADVCVYGATAAGVVAAVALRKRGRSVVIINPSGFVGGMTSGGLSFTDTGIISVIGGLSREFYRKCGAHYSNEEEFLFEPHVAERVFLEWLVEHQVIVYHRQFVKNTEMKGSRITRMVCESGLTVEAKAFIDCSYEGDLMARAGVKYTVGRESNTAYAETINGVQVAKSHQFPPTVKVDPYVIPGNPASGTLPGIDPAPLGSPGSADQRIQAYNFRLCLTQLAKKQRDFRRPTDYKRETYELLRRTIEAGHLQFFGKFDPIQNTKVDNNNFGPVSTDLIGGSDAWPEATYAAREGIFQRHVSWQSGWYYYLATEPDVPDSVRLRMAGYGFCMDEFPLTGGWSPQLYVREARRMTGEAILTENECKQKKIFRDSIGMGSYNMDSHNCRRFVDAKGSVRNEGDVQVGVKPYCVSYRCIVPRTGYCTNIWVPVALSATHIAYGSIRMEPVFMVLAESAAIAVDIALDSGKPSQAIPYMTLRNRLLTAGQVLQT